jgi:hypothetical protein
MTPSLPPHLRAQILGAARRAPSITARARRQRVLAVAIVGAAVTLALSVHFGVPGRPLLSVLMLSLGGAGSALAATFFAAGRGPRNVGRTGRTLAAVAMLSPFSVLLFATTARALDNAAAPVPFLGGTTVQHVTCFVVTLLLALGPFVALAYARKGSDPVHPRALGAALGAAAGVWGGALIDIHCSLVTIEHLSLAHAAPIAVLAAIGALVGGRLFGIREEPL